MATKTAPKVIDASNLIESFSEFKEVKNIDRVTLISILEDVFRGIIRKKFGSDENFDVIVNDKGKPEIWHNRQVVDDEFAEDSFDYDPNKHISLTEAHKKTVTYFLFQARLLYYPICFYLQNAGLLF